MRLIRRHVATTLALTLVAAVTQAPSLAQGVRGTESDRKVAQAQPARTETVGTAREIRLPPGDLLTALDTLAKYNSDTQIIYRRDQLQGIHTQGAAGTLTTRDAIKKLLEGTQLKLSIDANTGAMLIAPENTRTTSTGGTAESFRLAQSNPATEATREKQHDEAKKDEMKSSSPSDGGSASDDSTVKEFDTRGIPEILVRGSKSLNTDLPRSENDTQPYVILDREMLERSGAANIEEFLKQRLTMNTTALTNGQQRTAGAETSGGPAILGNTSSINLRGLGSDKTLVLINGRRMAGIARQLEDLQSDLNGIPIAAVERIEILPTSAAAIYGGGAVGGVVNVILKREYNGGEIGMTYDNTWDASARERTISGSYGMTLEEGRTSLSLTGQWSDGESLLLRDRRALYEKNRATILANDPTFAFADDPAGSIPPLGALPNVRGPITGLVLDDGTALGSRYTYIAPGTSASTSAADLNSSLLANAGLRNIDLPDSTQEPTGLRRPFGVTPETKSILFSANRKMSETLDVFLDLSYLSNAAHSLYNAFPKVLTVGISSPYNPFQSDVLITLPFLLDVPNSSESTTRIASLGLKTRLPANWLASLDYTFSEGSLEYSYFLVDDTELVNDTLGRDLNLFVDPQFLDTPVLRSFLSPVTSRSKSRFGTFALRASGPLLQLPWGAPRLTASLEHRTATVPKHSLAQTYPFTTSENALLTYFERKQHTLGAYVETDIPLVQEGRFPALHSLSMQLAARLDHYTVDSGTQAVSDRYNADPPSKFYIGPTLNGKPYFSEASYSSKDYVVGIKYQPLQQLIVRASLATAFLPPSPYELITNPTLLPDFVVDPQSPDGVEIETLTGGNPDVKPQHSRSLNVGLVWEPTARALEGLRLNAEYYRIKQYDSIGQLGAQQIVDREDLYPGRVTRNGSGIITRVDTTLLNLYSRETEGWDLRLDYRLNSRFGSFSFQAVESLIRALKTQYTATEPAYDAAGYSPDEGGAPRYKSNATLVWEKGGWTAGWAANYIGSYKQYGVAGGPTSLEFAGGGVYAPSGDTIIAQGSDTVSSQIYHDVFLSYLIAQRAGWSGLSGLRMKMGVRNVFNTAPSFDAHYSGNYYFSPYGDARLRSYLLSLSKTF